MKKSVEQKRLTGVQRDSMSAKLQKLNKESEKIRLALEADRRFDMLPKALKRGFKHIGKDGRGPIFEAWIVSTRHNYHEQILGVERREINLWQAAEGQGHYTTFVEAQTAARKVLRRRAKVIADAIKKLDTLTAEEVRK